MHMTTTIDAGDPRAVAATQAVRHGDVDRLRQLLADHRELATAAIGTGGPRGKSRTLLHAATDWPGHYPNVVASIQVLVEAGADVNARPAGPHTETPLHWAASSDDVDALDALLEAGADIEADGAVIAGGTALDDAVAFGQWLAARRLVERGAHVKLFNAAALGLLDRVREHLATDPPPATELTSAFWAACHGGQRSTAEHLLQRGAQLNWVAPWDGLTPLDAARRSNADDLAAWLVARGAQPATATDSTKD
jgi:ankyrin repeat protein